MVPALVRVEDERIVAVERFATSASLDAAFEAARRAPVSEIGSGAREVDGGGAAIEGGDAGGGKGATEFVDARGHIVAPAFVNAHTHLCMNLFRAFPTRTQTAGNLVEDLFFRLESHLDPGDVRAFARLGALECLASGTGLVWDHYYHAEAVTAALRDTGLCGVVAPTIQDLAGPGRGSAESAFAYTLVLHADHDAARAGVFAAFGPHATDTVSRSLWVEIAEQARARALPIHAHVAQSPEEYERVFAREGTSPAGFLGEVGALEEGVSMLAVHAIYATRSDLARLARARGTTLVFCPYSQLVFHFPADALAWERAGARWCVATDCAASNDSMNVQKEVRYVAGLSAIARSGGEPYGSFLASRSRAEAAQAAGRIRRDRARAKDVVFTDTALFEKVASLPGRVHPSFRAGVIAPGALANVALWKSGAPALWPASDPIRNLLWCDATGALEGLLCNGRWVARPGVSPSQLFASSKDVTEMVTEADERLAHLARRAGLSGLQFRQAQAK